MEFWGVLFFPNITLGCWIYFWLCKFNKAEGPPAAESDLGQTMEGFGFEHFADGARESQRLDYRKFVGDTEPSSLKVSSREAEFHIRQTPHSYGHESAAQRYSATRIQAGFGPERWVSLRKMNKGLNKNLENMFNFFIVLSKSGRIHLRKQLQNKTISLFIRLPAHTHENVNDF